MDTGADAHAVAVLMLCGKETPLRRQGDRLTATRRITCEGHGEVRVVLGDGRKATCDVSFVTPGAVQTFCYRLSDGVCNPTG